MQNVIDMSIRVMMQDITGAAAAGLIGKMGHVEQSAGNAGGSMHKMSGVQKIASGVMLGGALAFGTFAAAIKFAVDQASLYEQASLKVQTATGATDQQMKKLNPVLMDVANHSIYSISQIADMAAKLAQHGVTIKDLINTDIIKSVKNLSEAIRADPLVAADLLGTAIQMFGGNAKDAAKYSDLLTYAFEHGIPSAQKLGAYLGAVGPTAQSLHVPLREVIAVLDTMGHSMGTNTDLGAAMRYMLTTLSAPTGQQAAALAKLGIITKGNQGPINEMEAAVWKLGHSQAALVQHVHAHGDSVSGLSLIYAQWQKSGLAPANESFMQWATSTGALNDKMYDSKGNFKDLVGNINLLHDAYVKANPEAQAFVSKELFNTKSGTAAKDLVQHIGDLNGIMKDLNKTNDAHGLAAHNASLVEHTLAGEMAQVSTNVKSLAAIIGMQLIPMIEKLLQKFNDMMGPISKWVADHARLIATFLLVGLAVSAVVVVVAALVLVFTGALGPMGLIIGIAVLTYIAIMAISVGIALLIDNWGKIMQSPIGKWIEGIHYAWRLFAQFIGEQFMSELKGIGKQFGLLIDAMQPMMPVLKFIGEVIVGVVIAAIVGLIGFIVGLAAAIVTAIRGIVMIIKGFVEVVTGIVKAFGDIWNMLVDLFTGNTKKSKKDFEQFVRDIVLILAGLWHMIEGAVTTTFGALWEYIRGFIITIVSAFLGLANTLVGHSIIPDMLNSIFHWFTDIFGKVLSGIGGFISGAVNWFAGLPAKIMSALSGLGTSMQGFGANMINMFTAGITSAAGGVISGVGKIASGIGKLLGHHSPAQEGPLSDDDKWMPNMIDMFAGGVHGGIPRMHTATTALASAMVPSLQGAGGGYGAGGAGGTQTYNLILDHRTLASFTMNSITGQLQMNGVGRIMQ